MKFLFYSIAGTFRETVVNEVFILKLQQETIENGSWLTHFLPKSLLAYGNSARSTSGSQNLGVLPITAFLFAINKTKDNE